MRNIEDSVKIYGLYGEDKDVINQSNKKAHSTWIQKGVVYLSVCFRAAEACGGGHGPDQPGHETGWEKPQWPLQVLRPLCLPLWQVNCTVRAAEGCFNDSWGEKIYLVVCYAYVWFVLTDQMRSCGFSRRGRCIKQLFFKIATNYFTHPWFLI